MKQTRVDDGDLHRASRVVNSDTLRLAKFFLASITDHCKAGAVCQLFHGFTAGAMLIIEILNRAEEIAQFNINGWFSPINNAAGAS